MRRAPVGSHGNMGNQLHSQVPDLSLQHLDVVQAKCCDG